MLKNTNRSIPIPVYKTQVKMNQRPQQKEKTKNKLTDADRRSSGE